MYAELETSRHSIYLRVGRFAFYAHGRAIPSGWLPDDDGTPTSGEFIFALGPITFYLINYARASQ